MSRGWVGRDLRRAISAVLEAILLAPGIHPRDSVTTSGEELTTAYE
jgi:hypothetical protein